MTAKSRDHTTAESELQRRYLDGLKLTETNRALVGIFNFEQITQIICQAARDLVGADGSTFVLRDENSVRYVAENAIEPLWRGHNFPISCCISGWSILHGQPAIIEDIYADERIPHEAYRHTFVKSLVMMPVGPGAPVAAIGTYWAKTRVASAYEIELLRSLASAADLALAGARAYDETLQARALAEQANRVKDEFLATLSHELRNPLNIIVGYSELLLRNADRHPSSFVTQAASIILQNGKAQAQLINDLLDLSRLHTGKLNVDRKSVILNTIVNDTVTSLQNDAKQKNIHLRTDICSNSLRVDGDAVRLQQIIWNLACNAIKFTPPGGRVSVGLQTEGNEAKITVVDNGEGISKDFLPHIFEMFRQGNPSSTRKHGGMGIGLALVKQLVDLHGGRLEAFSEGRNRGSCFTFSIPLHESSIAELNSFEDDEDKSDQLNGVRILVIDDTLDSLAVLESLLSSEGAIVHTAASGDEALRLAAQTHYDVLISDIAMPEMDGYEFLKRLYSDYPRYQAIPAIALTGFGRAEDVEKAQRAGFVAHLTKPLNFDDLLEVTSAYISN